MVTFSEIYLESTESTNAYLKQLIIDEDCGEGTVVIAKRQTKGKGQQGNSWESEDFKNLTFSILLKPKIEAQEMFLVSKMVSIAMVKFLSKYANDFCIKWPNDIYFQDKKISGVLIENQILGSGLKHAVVGVGLNVNQKKFLSDAPNPTSLASITGQEFNLKKLLDEFLVELNYYLQLMLTKADIINKEYENLCYRNKGYYPYKNEQGEFMAKFVRVANDGQLFLETEAGDLRSFYFKEVEFCF